MFKFTGIIIFLLSNVLTVCAVHAWERNGFIRDLVFAMILRQVYLFAGTEFLSLLHLLSRNGVMALWGIYDLVFLLYLFRKRGSEKLFKLPAVEKKDAWFAAAVAVIFLIQFIFAYVTVPYNYDTMTYRLPRILMWIQNRSVSYYETDVIRQNLSPVLADFNNLHWILQCGNDRMANLVQYKAYVFCALVIWEILKELDCRKVVRQICVLLYMTANIALAESISTQTDLFTCGWLLCTLYISLLVKEKKELSRDSDSIFLMGMMAFTVGLTYLSKPNLCVTSAFVIIWLVIRRIAAGDRIPTLIAYVVFCGVVILVMVMPGWMRNLEFAGDITASKYLSMNAIGTWEPKYVVLNIVKNIACLSVLPYTGSIWTKTMIGLANVLNADLNAEAIAYGGEEYFVYYTNDMDLAGAPIVIIVSIVVLLAAVCYRLFGHNKSDQKKERSFFGSLLLASIVTLAMTRWSPFSSRLILHVVIILIIMSGYYLDRMSRKTSLFHGARKILWALLIGVSAVNMAMAWRYHGQIAMQGVGSSDAEYWRQYFRLNSGARDKSEATLLFFGQMKEKPETIGFYTDESPFVYPIMTSLSSTGQKMEFVHMEESAPAAEEQGIAGPEYVIIMGQNTSPDTVYYCRGISYEYMTSEFEGMPAYQIYRAVNK